MVDDGDAKRIALLDDTAIERDPVLDAAIGPALLAAIGRDGGPDRLRLYRPGPTVAFSGRDCATPGIGEAAAAAVAAGFTPVRRGPGGRAAAYHRGALCLVHVSADVDARSDIRARFIGFGELLVDALRAVGTDARLGPVPGEYCPGEFSINDGHGRKLVGTAQRLVRGAWLFGTVIMVTGAEPVRSVLVTAYRALGLDWNPGTVGSVEDTVPGVTVADVQRAVLAGYARLGELTPGGLSAEVLRAADDRRENHQVAAAGPPPAVIPPIHAVE